MKANGKRRVVAMMVFLVSSSSLVWAADEPAPPLTTTTPEFSQPWEKGSVKFGGMFTAFDSSLGFGLKKVGGVYIDGEEVLGLESTLLVWRVDALFRFTESRRHQFDFTYASYNRTARTTLTEEIVIDGETLVPGTEISTVFDFDIIRGTYSYALLQDNRMRLAVGFGLYAVPVRYGLDITTPGDTRSLEIRDITLPLPSLALRGDFLLIPKLFLTTELHGMYLNFGGFEGSLMDVSVGVEYRPWKHWGFGVAYSALELDVKADEGSDYPGADFVGKVNVQYTGLMFYGKFLF